MRLIGLPGVHRPVSDTWLLADAMRKEGVAGAAVLDLCTGTGAVAITAAKGGAARVVAVDLTRRAAISASVNTRLTGAEIVVRRGDLFGPVAGERFDIIVSNPPYIPAETDKLPRHGKRVALDAGRDGRILIDRICAAAAAHLQPGGALLIVHSSVCGAEQTCEAMRCGGLEPEVAVEHHGPLGPVMTARAPMMRERGLLGSINTETVVVVRGIRLISHSLRSNLN